MTKFFSSVWAGVDAFTKAGAQLVKAAIALAVAAFFAAIVFNIITG